AARPETISDGVERPLVSLRSFGRDRAGSRAPSPSSPGSSGTATTSVRARSPRSNSASSRPSRDRAPGPPVGSASAPRPYLGGREFTPPASGDVSQRDVHLPRVRISSPGGDSY